MKRSVRNLLAAAALFAAPTLMSQALAGAQGTEFTYQGRLTDGGAPASGAYDLQVLLFDSAVGGSQVGATQTINDISVVNGVFSAVLDFGSQFDSNARWIEIRVRPGASLGAYTTISPRTAIDSAPYALGLRLPLTQSMNLAAPLITITNSNTSNASNVMKLISGVPSGNSAGSLDPVFVADSNNGNGVVALTSWPNAMSIYAVHSNSGNAITGINSGTGAAGTFDITNAASAANALDVGTVGTGRAAYFTSTKTTATLPTVYANNAATGDSIPNSSQDNGVAIKGEATGGFGIGVMGKGSNAGVFGYGTATGSAGVWGKTGGAGGDSSTGVRGDGNGAGTSGVSAFNNLGTAVYAQGATAGQFVGNVTINGTLNVTGSKNFKIDHPLDPSNKFLVHAAVESSEMKNIYDGIITLGTDGSATVTMPNYFGALNTEYRYQLTCVGGQAMVFVAEEMSENHFKIAGGKPGMKVSWQVTGVRHDPSAASHSLKVEMDKVGSEIGRYMDPAAYGQPESKQISPMNESKAAKSVN